MKANTLAHDPKIIVCLLPTLSEIIPVGISKNAALNITMPKILVPKVYEPETLVK